MSIDDLKQEIARLKENHAKDEYDLGSKEHQLREQADRIQRHLKDGKELIRMKEKQLEYKVLQEQQHDKLLEG